MHNSISIGKVRLFYNIKIPNTVRGEFKLVTRYKNLYFRASNIFYAKDVCHTKLSFICRLLHVVYEKYVLTPQFVSR